MWRSEFLLNDIRRYRRLESPPSWFVKRGNEYEIYDTPPTEGRIGARYKHFSRNPLTLKAREPELLDAVVSETKKTFFQNIREQKENFKAYEVDPIRITRQQRISKIRCGA